MIFNKVAICGSHSCGKTTLLNELKTVSIFNIHPVIHEIAAKYPVKTRINIETQFKIMQHQAVAERTLIQNYGKFLSDRSVLDNIAYSTLVHNRYARSPKDKEIYKRCYTLSYAHLHNIIPSYDLLIFVDEILPYKESDHRNFSDFKDQQFIYDYIKNELKSLTIPTIFVSGTTKQRIDTILEYISYNKDV